MPRFWTRCRVGAGVAMLMTAMVAGSAVPSEAGQSPQAQTPAQAAEPRTGLLRVFLDCQYECDAEFLRQNVTFVDYVRDRAVADVHVLVMTQGTGGGGSAWAVRFIGLSTFQGQERTLTFTTPTTATSDDRRKELARVFKLGVAGYAAETTVAPQLDVVWNKPTDQPAQTTPARDPWNFWVFRVSGNGNMNGEQQSRSRSIRASFSASRTTEDWKINISGSRDSNRSTFDLEDGAVITSRRASWNVSTLMVKSLGPKLSAGFRSRASHSSFSNTDRSFNLAPGIEYDFFPYSESSRRSLTVQYNVGTTHYNYRDLTVFDKLTEMVPDHGVTMALGLRQPWGSVSAVASVHQHLNKTSRFRTGVFGSTDVRLFKGFSFNVFGSYDKIKDQISLPKGSASTEEVLLRLRQLQTNYSYHMSFGLSYSFGSIFNSVVNPRFGGGSGIIFF